MKAIRRRAIVWGLLSALLAVTALALAAHPQPAVSAAAAPFQGYVALTFDDGPWPRTTRALLDGLARRGAHATFFLIGRQVAGQEKTVRRMVEEGHQVGLHTWDHVSLQGCTAEQIRAQLERTRQAILPITGPADLMLRPPYGFTDDTLRAQAGAPIITWSVDTEDWKDKDPDRMVQTVLTQVRDGSIVLMHDIFPTSVQAALRCADGLLARGYRLVTVEELFALRGIEARDGVVYTSLVG